MLSPLSHNRTEKGGPMHVFDPAGLGLGTVSTPCPSCNGVNVGSFTVTSLVVYLRCSDCAHAWSIPERRRVPRASDNDKRFG